MSSSSSPGSTSSSEMRQGSVSPSPATTRRKPFASSSASDRANSGANGSNRRPLKWKDMNNSGQDYPPDMPRPSPCCDPMLAGGEGGGGHGNLTSNAPTLPRPQDVGF